MSQSKLTDPATLTYLEKNKYRGSLPKFMLEQGKPRPFPGRSVSSLLWLKLRSVRAIASGIIKNTFRYSKLSRLAKLKGTGTGKSALVLGNGPSQGLLDPSKLHRFVKQGHHLFVVNFYHSNISLSRIYPTYHVLSDPNSLNASAPTRLTEKNESLRRYLVENRQIMICVPLEFNMDSDFEHRSIYFNDTEASWWYKNTNPLLPRGYLSMTLYKALAIACFIGYDNIYTLGMDNTYPHDVFVDRRNHVCNIERHTGGSDHMIDQSPFYRRTEDVLWDSCLLFYDLKQFERHPIINLDPYSLTNVFPKADNEKTTAFLFDGIF